MATALAEIATAPTSTMYAFPQKYTSEMPTNRCADKKHLLHDLQLPFCLLYTMFVFVCTHRSTEIVCARASTFLCIPMHSIPSSILCQIISDFNFLHRWIFTITPGPFCLCLVVSRSQSFILALSLQVVWMSSSVSSSPPRSIPYAIFYRLLLHHLRCCYWWWCYRRRCRILLCVN